MHFPQTPNFTNAYHCRLILLYLAIGNGRESDSHLADFIHTNALPYLRTTNTRHTFSDQRKNNTHGNEQPGTELR